MASNKHYEIDLIDHEIVETEPLNFEELLRLADLPNSPNPFGHILKRDKFVNDTGKKWLLDKQLAEFNYQTSGYSSEVSQFHLSLSFDTPLELSEIDSDRLLYSIARHISQSNWRNRRRGVGSFFQLGQVEEGSIRVNLYAGVVAVSAFVANYPDLKQGFQEILTDTQFITEQISTALRAAKLPEPVDDEREHHAPEMLTAEEQRRREPPNRIRLLRDN